MQTQSRTIICSSMLLSPLRNEEAYQKDMQGHAFRTEAYGLRNDTCPNLDQCVDIIQSTQN